MPVSPALSEGDKAPSFSLPQAGGGRVSLANFKGQKLALYFYPKADTEGCTREAIDFSALAKAFARAGTAVLGVSADALARLDAFRAKHKLTVPLGSDESLAMLPELAAPDQVVGGIAREVRGAVGTVFNRCHQRRT